MTSDPLKRALVECVSAPSSEKIKNPIAELGKRQHKLLLPGPLVSIVNLLNKYLWERDLMLMLQKDPRKIHRTEEIHRYDPEHMVCGVPDGQGTSYSGEHRGNAMPQNLQLENGGCNGERVGKKNF